MHMGYYFYKKFLYWYVLVHNYILIILNTVLTKLCTGNVWKFISQYKIVKNWIQISNIFFQLLVYNIFLEIIKSTKYNNIYPKIIKIIVKIWLPIALNWFILNIVKETKHSPVLWILASWHAFITILIIINIFNAKKCEQIRIDINKIDSVANGSVNGENFAT